MLGAVAVGAQLRWPVDHACALSIRASTADVGTVTVTMTVAAAPRPAPQCILNYYTLGRREALAIADYACGDLSLTVLGQKVIEKRCFCHKRRMRPKRAATIPV